AVRARGRVVLKLSAAADKRLHRKSLPADLLSASHGGDGAAGATRTSSGTAGGQGEAVSREKTGAALPSRGARNRPEWLDAQFTKVWVPVPGDDQQPEHGQVTDLAQRHADFEGHGPAPRQVGSGDGGGRDPAIQNPLALDRE